MYQKYTRPLALKAPFQTAVCGVPCDLETIPWPLWDNVTLDSAQAQISEQLLLFSPALVPRTLGVSLFTSPSPDG